MENVIIHDCPICGKSARAIDKREEAACDDLTPCDGNETYSCYRSEKNSEWRFVARRSKPMKPNFQPQPTSVKLGYHKQALTL